MHTLIITLALTVSFSPLAVSDQPQLLMPAYQPLTYIPTVRARMDAVAAQLTALSQDDTKKAYLELDAVLSLLLAKVHQQLTSAQEFLNIVQGSPAEQLSQLRQLTHLGGSSPSPSPTAGHLGAEVVLADAHNFTRNVSVNPHERDAMVLWREGMLQLFGLAQPQIMRVERMLVVGEELLQKLQTAKNAPNLPVPLAARLSSTWVELNNRVVELAKVRDEGQATFRDNRDADLIERMPKLVVEGAAGGRCPVCNGEFKQGELVGKPGLQCEHLAHVRCALKRHEKSERWDRHLRKWASTCAVCNGPVVPSGWGAPATQEGHGHSHRHHHRH